MVEGGPLRQHCFGWLYRETAGGMTRFLNSRERLACLKSQDSAVEAILDHKDVAGDIVVIRYEGHVVVQACMKCCIQPVI